MKKLYRNTILTSAWLILQGCAMEPDAVDIAAGDSKPAAAADQALTEVSPELFDLITAWSAGDGLTVSAQATDLLAHVQSSHPELVAEATQLLERDQQVAKSIGTDSLCSCRLVAAVDANPIQTVDESQSDREMRDWPNRSKVKWEYIWNASANGAAHRGSLYRYHYHGESGHERNRTNHTQMRVQLLCTDSAGVRCEGSCQGQMYLFAEYGTRMHGYAETGGVWDKSAQASVADGAVLSYARPFQAATRLFEKLGSVTHHASTTSFNVDQLATLAASALTIVTAISTENPELITGDLLSKIIKAFAGLVSRSGSDGTTEREMFVAYDSTRDGYFDIAFSSTANQVHTFRLETHARVKNRGWGGHNTDTSWYASSYLMAAGFDLYTCDANLTPPAPGALWRYASTTSAPYDSETLRVMTQAFFNALGFSVSVNGSSGGSGIVFE